MMMMKLEQELDPPENEIDHDGDNDKYDHGERDVNEGDYHNGV